MRIAILISTYNGGKYLDEQLESLFNQTVANLSTVYIRDDGSKDNTFNIVENWKKKLNIKLFKGHNIGPAMSFWELLCNSEIEADYYLFCDQDDVWDRDKIEKSIVMLKENTHLSICNCRIINSTGKVTNEMRVKQLLEFSLQGLFVSGVTQGCSMAFTKTLRDYILSLDLRCIPMHDIVLMLYAMNFGKVFWIEEPLFGYRVHESNVVDKQNKSFRQKLKTTYWNLKNSSKNSMSSVAIEFVTNRDDFSEEERVFLNAMSYYRDSLKNKRTIMFDSKVKKRDRKALTSYRVRAILGLL